MCIYPCTFVQCMYTGKLKYVLCIFYRKIGRDLANTFAKLEKLTMCK